MPARPAGPCGHAPKLPGLLHPTPIIYMYMRTRALVLRTTKYNDEAVITHLLTQSHGCIDMWVRVSRSRRAAVRHTLFQPLTLVEVEWNEQRKADLKRPTAARAVQPFASLPYEPSKLAIALFLADFLHHAVRSEQDASDVFGYVVDSLQWLDACPSSYANFHLVFLLRLTRFLGFMPEVADYVPGSYFDMRSGTFGTGAAPHADCLTPADAAWVPKLLRMRYETMRVFRFSGADRSRLLAALNRYYALHLPGFPDLKSLDVLREMF